MTVQKIQTKAKKDAHGTFVSATTGEIVYVDANHEDERHHSPVFTHAEADEAFKRGLIEDPKDAKVIGEEELEEAIDETLIGNVAAERTGEFAKVDGEVSPQPSTLDSRQSTAWNDADRVQGGAEGYAAGVRAADDGVDAPPARARGARSAPKTAAAPKS